MIRSLFRRLRQNAAGAAIVELALALPIMSVLLVGMSDLARAYSLRVQLEQVAQRAIEKVEQQKSVSTSYNTALSTEATNALSDLGYTSGNTVTPDSWTECSSDSGSTWTRQTNFTDPCAGGNQTARYVSVTVSRTYDPLFSTHNWPGAATISGYAQVRIQ